MKKFKNLDCVLLVDDDKFMNLFHTKVVERSSIGVSVKAIDNVREALAYLTRSGMYEHTQIVRPGIIFLDINMPGLSGWDFIELYDQIDSTDKDNTIIVMLTASSNPDDRKRALSNKHIVDFVTKPLKADVIINLTERYFEPD